MKRKSILLKFTAFCLAVTPVMVAQFPCLLFLGEPRLPKNLTK